jgi:hypothetical protein
MKNPEWIFEEDLKWSKLKLARTKENFEYRKFFENFKKCEDQLLSDGLWPGREFVAFGLWALRNFVAHPQYEKIIDMLDPSKDLKSIPKQLIESVLPRLFFSFSVEAIGFENQPSIEAPFTRTLKSLDSDLKPWERTLKLDLRKKTSQIKREFEAFLEIV